MTEKEYFINEVEKFELTDRAKQYLEKLKNEKPKSKFTENGLKILTWMRENEEERNNIFKAKDIGEGLFMPPKSASGSLRKLVTDGYVNKTKGDAVIIYSLTESGRTTDLTN